jgi:uncharacterized protein
MNKKFRILSIDGGGIRGIFPAMFLAEYEAKLRADGNPNWQAYQNFDLICGTSTGGIIAIALSLGIPASEIVDLYYNNAKAIFGNKRSLLFSTFIASIFKSGHERTNLEKLVRDKFASTKNGEDPRLLDCKTNTFVTIYDLQEGVPSILKSKYHPKFVRDYHIPAYQAALATSAAPTYFDPLSTEYVDLNGLTKPFQNKVDGGVFCNNPTLSAIVEAQEAFDLPLESLVVLSLGTGTQKFCDAGFNPSENWIKKVLLYFPRKIGLFKIKSKRSKWGILYWMNNNKRKPLIDVFMQGQSQQVENIISLMHSSIGKSRVERFTYLRVNTELDSSCNIELDETDEGRLDALKEKGVREFQKNADKVFNNFVR